MPLVGLIGAVLMPHNLFLHSSLVLEKKIPETDYEKSLFYFKFETAISLFISFLISTCVVGTFAFWANTDSDIDLTNAAFFIDEKFGKYAKYVWAMGLLAAGISSTLTGTLAG